MAIEDRLADIEHKIFAIEKKFTDELNESVRIRKVLYKQNKNLVATFREIAILIKKKLYENIT